MRKLLFILLTFCSTGLFASGYIMTGHGARYMGKGGTGITDSGNAMALFYNPALLAKVKGLRLYVNTTYAYNFTDIDTKDLNYSVFVEKDKKKDFTIPGGTVKSSRVPFVEPALFLSWGLPDQEFGFGLGAYGAMISGPHFWPQPPEVRLSPSDNFAANGGNNHRFGFNRVEVWEMAIAISGAWNLKRLGLSELTLGFTLEWLEVTATQDIDLPIKKIYKDVPKTNKDGKVNYTEDDVTSIYPSRTHAEISQKGAFSFAVGALFEPNDWLSMGAYFHPKKPYHLSGSLSTLIQKEIGWFNALGSDLLMPAEDFRLVKDVDLDLSMPSTLAFGISVKTGKWKFEGDTEIVFWSVVEDFNIEGLDKTVRLDVKGTDPKQPPIIDDIYLDIIPENINYPKNWQNTLALKYGVSYEYSKEIELRTGAFFETSAVPPETLDTSLIDSDKMALTLGMGWESKYFVIDFSYMFVYFLPVEVERSKTKVTNLNSEFDAKRRLKSGREVSIAKVEDPLTHDITGLGLGKYKSIRHHFALGIEFKWEDAF